MPRKKVTTADMLKEIGHKAVVHPMLTVRGSYYDTTCDAKWEHSYNAVVAFGKCHLALQGLQSRLERMTRPEFREFLCKLGVIGAGYATDKTSIFSKPVFKIRFIKPGTEL